MGGAASTGDLARAAVAETGRPARPLALPFRRALGKTIGKETRKSPTRWLFSAHTSSAKQSADSRRRSCAGLHLCRHQAVAGLPGQRGCVMAVLVSWLVHPLHFYILIAGASKCSQLPSNPHRQVVGPRSTLQIGPWLKLSRTLRKPYWPCGASVKERFPSISQARQRPSPAPVPVTPPCSRAEKHQPRRLLRRQALGSLYLSYSGSSFSIRFRRESL